MNALNLQVFDWIHGFAGISPFLDEAGIFFAAYAPYIVGILFFVFLARHTKDWRMRIAMFADAALTMIIARGLIAEAIHYFFPMLRPFAALGFTSLIPESGSAFPSGHATFFFALATTVMFYDQKTGSWFLFFAILNGIARIFVGVHWPLDIVGGALVGVLGSVLSHGLIRKYLSLLHFHRNAQKS